MSKRLFESCHKCPKRNQWCHSSCKDYLDDMKENEEDRTRKFDAAQKEYNVKTIEKRRIARLAHAKKK